MDGFRQSVRPGGTGRPASRNEITLLVGMAIWLLLLMPIPGLPADTAMLRSPGIEGSLSVAMIALQTWSAAVILAQLAVLALPARWTTRVAAGGLVNPLSLPILALSAVIACGRAWHQANAFSAMALLTGGGGSHALVLASLLIGTALVIAGAWVIERHGVGHGFWVVLAVYTIAEGALAVLQIPWMLALAPPGAVVNAFASALGAVLLAAWLTAHILSRGGRFEHVAWPGLMALYLSALAAELEFGALLLMLLALGLVCCILLWRAGLVALAPPILVVLGAIACAQAWVTPPALWSIPAPWSELMASTAFLTALWRQRSVRASPDRPG